jgi:hypothetical protein
VHLENKILELEHQSESLHRRIEDDQRSHQQKLETEVKQKNKWMLRYTEEHDALKGAQKEVSDFKGQVADMKARTQVSERMM